MPISSWPMVCCGSGVYNAPPQALRWPLCSPPPRGHCLPAQGLRGRGPRRTLIGAFTSIYFLFLVLVSDSWGPVGLDPQLDTCPHKEHWPHCGPSGQRWPSCGSCLYSSPRQQRAQPPPSLSIYPSWPAAHLHPPCWEPQSGLESWVRPRVSPQLPEGPGLVTCE